MEGILQLYCIRPSGLRANSIFIRTHKFSRKLYNFPANKKRKKSNLFRKENKVYAIDRIFVQTLFLYPVAYPILYLVWPDIQYPVGYSLRYPASGQDVRFSNFQSDLSLRPGNRSSHGLKAKISQPSREDPFAPVAVSPDPSLPCRPSPLRSYCSSSRPRSPSAASPASASHSPRSCPPSCNVISRNTNKKKLGFKKRFHRHKETDGQKDNVTISKTSIRRYFASTQYTIIQTTMDVKIHVHQSLQNSILEKKTGTRREAKLIFIYIFGYGMRPVFLAFKKNHFQF